MLCWYKTAAALRYKHAPLTPLALIKDETVRTYVRITFIHDLLIQPTTNRTIFEIGVISDRPPFTESLPVNVDNANPERNVVKDNFLINLNILRFLD